jgi:hypothetical protein
LRAFNSCPERNLASFAKSKGTGACPIVQKGRNAIVVLRRIDDEDKKENELSVREGFRILSAYNLETDVKVWIITEWDRSATTVLLPEEY